jgi:hypothetical protein
MSRIEEARKILGDDYVIVPLSSWNHDVEEHKKLLSRIQIAEEALKKAYNLDGYMFIKEALEQIQKEG